MKKFDFEDVFGETENVTSEMRLLEEEKLGKIFDEIDFNLETDCFDEAKELLDKIQADFTRELWVYNARFYLQRLMVDLKVSDDEQLAKKCDEAVLNDNFKKVKKCAEKANDREMLARVGRIEAFGAEIRAEEERKAEEQRLAQEEKRKEIERDFEISDGVLVKYKGSKTEVVIPDCVTSIGKNAFYSWTSLTSITIPNSVISIGDYAFSMCTNLTSITIPDSVMDMGKYVFNCCSSLASITIPDKVTSIGKGAFSNCRILASITIPDSVTSISDQAFNCCNSLTSITIPGRLVSNDLCIPDGCEIIRT